MHPDGQQKQVPEVPLAPALSIVEVGEEDPVEERFHLGLSGTFSWYWKKNYQESSKTIAVWIYFYESIGLFWVLCSFLRWQASV